jgi:CRP/FNR family transcriptional regulator, cyclic AMP receptor protein
MSCRRADGAEEIIRVGEPERRCQRVGDVAELRREVSLPPVSHGLTLWFAIVGGRAWSLLAPLTDDEQRQVLAAARRRRFRKGEVLFHEGDPGATLHLLEKGTVAVKVSTPFGDVATLAVLGPGECFGEQILLAEGAVRTASVIALEPVETLSMSRDAFQALRERHPSADRFLVEVLAAQVRRLSEQLAEALFVPADTRVLRKLLAVRVHYPPKDGLTVIPLTQEEIAMLAGTTRSTANRVLRSAEQAGAIRLGRGLVEIVDDELLARKAR